ncbi:MAG: histone deacetylase family protein [Thermoleophilia bacterium]|nr:histone deacetylase family protein [Thermoleophilia bacterium]
MSLSIPVVTDARCLLHEPLAEVFVGERTPATELPERNRRIAAALCAAGAPSVAAIEHGLDPILAVHEAGLVEWLENAWVLWQQAGLAADPGRDRVTPYLFPTPGLLAGLPERDPAATWARAGRWCFDTMTLVGPGTWEAALGAADCAVTAADLVVGGAHAAYALTRPPGHHVTRAAYGGSCYLNNAAIAAERLRAKGFGAVAILDLDAHHGNGQQALFWEREDVRTGSAHVDPAAGWFPHHVGWAEETGGAAGSNLNLPLAPGTGDEGWLEAVRTLVAFGASARALVVALGVDAAEGDPEAPLRVTEAGFSAAGTLVRSLGLPTVVVQEGGYDLARIGALVEAFLSGLDT